mgnify:CR=1 FL=1
MKEYHFTSGNSGIMISLFFLAIMLPGFILNQIVSFFGKKTKFACMVSISVGMALILVSRTEWLIGLGCIFTGLGYGVIQPIAYDKTTRTAIPEKRDACTGIRYGHELSGHSSLPFHYKHTQGYAPYRDTAVRFHLQYGHCPDSCRMGLPETRFVLVRRPHQTSIT